MGMKQKDLELIAFIVQLAFKYGWPAVMTLIATLKKPDDEITLEEVKGLKIDDDEPFIP